MLLAGGLGGPQAVLGCSEYSRGTRKTCQALGEVRLSEALWRPSPEPTVRGSGVGLVTAAVGGKRCFGLFSGIR